MSPASQGGLQVERYIGTCLISKADAPRYPHHGTWAGLPLISMVQPRRNKPPPQQHPQQHPQHPQPARSPLSRLAIHTQGAPLILAGRYNNRKHGQPNVQNNQGLGQQPVGQHPVAHKGGPRAHRPLAPPPCGPLGPVPCGPCGPCGPLPPAASKQVVGSASSDSLSVASDESSGHSENSLPRIIKPRKRRKKDRKPLQLASDTATAPASDTAPTHAPTTPTPAAVPTVSLRSLGGEAEQADEPKLHHDFDEVKEHESADEAVLLCQCRYCDPAGLIWDVDQNCYSPFLTPQPLSNLFISDTSARFPDLGHPDLGHPAAVGTRGGSDLLLRRSWSEPMPSRKHSESSDSQDSDRRTPPSRQALEVSSEIVTSHNGHRDIEIKFFSAPTSASELDCRQ